MEKRPAFYQGQRWRKLRQLALNDAPLCRRCAENGHVEVAKVVHHITPIRWEDVPDRDWRQPEIWNWLDDHMPWAIELRNLETLCRQCHEVQHGRAGRRGRAADRDRIRALGRR